MGQSTNGQICFGVVFEGDYEFPWDDELHTGDLEEWWLREAGFKPKHPIHDETGNWIGGVKPTDAQYNLYFSEKREFKKAHPLPVEEVNYCSGECPMYILAVPSSLKSASRGYPKEFDPAALKVTEEEKAALIKFCEKYGLEPESPEPTWLLSSYWG
jgi:hypothetical protein